MPDSSPIWPLTRWESAWHILFPLSCPFCGCKLKIPRRVCEACEKEVHVGRKEVRLQVGNRPFHVYAPFFYQDQVRAAFLRYKFYNRPDLYRFFGDVMAGTLSFLREEQTVITWIPVSLQRKKQRGYDQSELLARRMGKVWKRPALPLLLKKKDNKTQHELSKKERLLNVKGVYEAQGEITGKRILLIDDILTTGSTMQEAASVLSKSGADHVTGVVAAIRGCNQPGRIL